MKLNSQVKYDFYLYMKLCSFRPEVGFSFSSKKMFNKAGEFLRWYGYEFSESINEEKVKIKYTIWLNNYVITMGTKKSMQDCARRYIRRER